MIFVEPKGVYSLRTAQPKPTGIPHRPAPPPLNPEESEIAEIVARLGGGPIPIMKVVNEVARQSGCHSTDERTAVKLTAMQTIGMMIHIGQLLRVERKYVRLPIS